MKNFSDNSNSSYEPNKIAASVLAVIICSSLLLWIIQSIQVQIQPRRLILLLFVSHVMIFVELVLRASLPIDIRRSRAASAVTTVLLTISQRTVILSNFEFLVQVDLSKSCLSRTIIIGTISSILTSAILMISSGILSHNTDTIDISFHLRQASAIIVLLVTILFYPIWFATKTWKHMKKQAIILLTISSIICLIIAIFLLITSIPYYYVRTRQQELWSYIFYFVPLAIALLTWTTFHPKRTLKFTHQHQQNLGLNINDSLLN
ncbi:hypothetical protein I4U23_012910 [Adineta vaga]|nr:hypothetical protein I4U23_012910 [Adineta vaga]